MKVIKRNGNDEIVYTFSDDETVDIFTDKVVTTSCEILDLNSSNCYIETIKDTFVTQTLTPRQFRLALLQEGLLDDVEAITAQNREHQIYFEYSLDFQRNHPLLIAMASAMGLTEAQIDDLFVLGGTL